MIVRLRLLFVITAEAARLNFSIWRTASSVGTCVIFDAKMLPLMQIIGVDIWLTMVSGNMAPFQHSLQPKLW